MSLARQLYLVVSALFLAIFIGLLGVSLAGIRHYLEEQLGAHAQDAASALSLPLAQSLGRGDLTLARVQVAALFDRGHFQRIIVIGSDGRLLLKQELPAKVDGVPQWFSQGMQLHVPAGESFVVSGWRQLGKVIVVSWPTYAYRHLWRSTAAITLSLAILYIATLLLVRLFLNRWAGYGVGDKSRRCFQENETGFFLREPEMPMRFHNDVAAEAGEEDLARASGKPPAETPGLTTSRRLSVELERAE